MIASRFLVRAPVSSLAPKQTPFLWSSVRAYDRKLYNKQKKALRDVENQTNVTLSDAMAALRMYSMSENKTLSIHILCPKPEEGSKPIRGDVSLPHVVDTASLADGAGLSEKLLVFATGKHAEEATRLGAQIVGGEELLEKIEKGELVFDRCLATKEMFPIVLKIAKFLGPKGLMPSPGRGTVSDDIAGMINSIKSVTKFSADSQGIVTMDICQTQWSDQQIHENIHALLKSVLVNKPPKVEATKYIEAMVLSGPLLPGLKLPMRPFNDILS
ncbi:ribosomal protein L1 [Rhizoclosmatium globosum]|uniref:Ribosomal protein n=1 Tax=Rhizoclosmatium globosum TaxID=329046 RepID=A0A1Y2BPG9_9FUNG|nr:ribosomal protein L1 [Rhizoclosmatium globosum]|eukprot:ORY36642.1 ribosomal protein L1 [Rhizoclosmatium globosum]